VERAGVREESATRTYSPIEKFFTQPNLLPKEKKLFTIPQNEQKPES
jgi:hypothetical protein